MCVVLCFMPSTDNFGWIYLSLTQQQEMEIENNEDMQEQEIDWNEQASNDWNQCSVNETNDDDKNAVDTAMNGVESWHHLSFLLLLFI